MFYCFWFFLLFIVFVCWWGFMGVVEVFVVFLLMDLFGLFKFLFFKGLLFMEVKCIVFGNFKGMLVLMLFFDFMGFGVFIVGGMVGMSWMIDLC